MLCRGRAPCDLLETKRRWTNPETVISYPVKLQSVLQGVEKTDGYVLGMCFGLSVDLSTSNPAEIPTIWG